MNRIIFTTKHSLPKDVYPRRTNSYAAGIDLYSPVQYEIKSQDRALIGTGWEVTLPHRHYGRIADVSYLPFLTGVHVIAGVIDCDYEGEIQVLLVNPTKTNVILRANTKIAQLIITPYCDAQPAVITSTLRSQIDYMSQRGSAGFGFASTEEAFNNPAHTLNLSNLPTGQDETWRGIEGRGQPSKNAPLPFDKETRLAFSSPSTAPKSEHESTTAARNGI
jgi:dUTP pyrophosphatase